MTYTISAVPVPNTVHALCQKLWLRLAVSGAALRHSSTLYTVDLWLCHGGHQFYFLTVLLNWYSFTTRCRWRVVHLIPAQYARLYATFMGPSTSCNRNYYPHPHHCSYDLSKTLTLNPNHFWSYFLLLVRLDDFSPPWIEWLGPKHEFRKSDRPSIRFPPSFWMRILAHYIRSCPSGQKIWLKKIHEGWESWDANLAFVLSC